MFVVSNPVNQRLLLIGMTRGLCSVKLKFYLSFAKLMEINENIKVNVIIATTGEFMARVIPL